jgi:hypothetical protein
LLRLVCSWFTCLSKWIEVRLYSILYKLCYAPGARETKKAIDDISTHNRVYQYNLFADTGISSFEDERTIVF